MHESPDDNPSSLAAAQDDMRENIQYAQNPQDCGELPNISKTNIPINDRNDSGNELRHLQVNDVETWASSPCFERPSSNVSPDPPENTYVRPMMGDASKGRYALT